MDSLFKKFMLGFLTQLKTEYGFKITTDRVLSLFKVYGEYDFFDEEEIKHVLKSLFCQSEEERKIFNQAFNSYFKKEKEASAEDMTDRFLDDIIKSLNDKYNELEETVIEANADFMRDIHDGDNLEGKVKDDLYEIVCKIETANKDMLFNILIKDGAALYKICQLNKKEQKSIIKLLEKEMQDVMLYAIEHELCHDVLDAILEACTFLSEYVNKYNQMTSVQQKEKDAIQKQINKLESKKHRDVYVKGHNAVQTEGGYMYKDFSKLNEKDLEKINGFIKKNAITIKTRIAKSIKKKTLAKLDYKKTMKTAARTDMIPMELFYKKARKQKTKIICITDISGSCKNASQILMTFIYALQEAFPGGVESFVFVKQLREATEVFRNYSLKEANERTSVLVQRDYSSYYEALKQFDTNFFERITKDTIVIFLGDVRNNNNESGAEYIEKMAKKVKNGKGKICWLNPEPKNEWNTGDSIMSEYSKYTDISASVQNTSDLVKFLNAMF